MARTIYVSGKFRSDEDARSMCSITGLLYGDGIFEGIRAYNGRVFKLDRHLDRLFESAKALRLERAAHAPRDRAASCSTPAGGTRSSTATSAWSSRAASAIWASIRARAARLR